MTDYNNASARSLIKPRSAASLSAVIKFSSELGTMIDESSKYWEHIERYPAVTLHTLDQAEELDLD